MEGVFLQPLRTKMLHCRLFWPNRDLPKLVWLAIMLLERFKVLLTSGQNLSLKAIAKSCDILGTAGRDDLPGLRIVVAAIVPFPV